MAQNSHESQPFIGSSTTAIRSNANHRRRFTLGIGKTIAIAFGAIVGTLIVMGLLLFYVLIWPDPCFKVSLKSSTSPSPPIELGLDIRSSRIFLILSKSLPTGTFHSPMKLCGKSQKFDTTILPAFSSINLGPSSGTIRVDGCSMASTKDDQIITQKNTLKLVIEGDVPFSNATTNGISVFFTLIDKPPKSNRLRTGSIASGGGSKFVHLSAVDGKISSQTPKRVKIDFLHESTLTFEPAIGAIFSEKLQFFTSEIILLPAKSPINRCGAPAVGFKISSVGVFQQVREAISYFLENGWHQLFSDSPIAGITQLLFITSIKISEFIATTNPLMIDFKMGRNSRLAGGGGGVFTLKESNFKLEQSLVRVDNLTLEMSDSQLSLKSFITFDANISHARVKGWAKPIGNNNNHVKISKETPSQLSPAEIFFHDSQFRFFIDTDLSFQRDNSSENLSPTDFIQKVDTNNKTTAGRFRMKNVFAAQYGENNNSSLVAMSIGGNFETIYIRSSRVFIADPSLIQLIFLFDFTIYDVRGQQVKVAFGSDSSTRSPSPGFALQLYRIGRISNNMKLGFSFQDHYSASFVSANGKNNSTEKNTKPPPFAVIAAALMAPPPATTTPAASFLSKLPFLKSSSPRLFQQHHSLVSALAPPSGMELQLWAFSIADVRAAAFLPAKSYFQIDRISFKLDPSATSSSSDSKNKDNSNKNNNETINNNNNYNYDYFALF